MNNDHKILGLPENACIFPWKHVAIDVNGEVKPCCRFQPRYHRVGPDKDLKIPVISEGMKKAYIDSDFFKKIRERMLNNEKLAICNKCWDAEAASGKSMRTNFNAEYTDRVLAGEFSKEEILTPTLDYLEIGFSSHCNLACRMCGPRLSSRWAAIERQYNLAPNPNEVCKEPDFDIDSFDVDLSKLKSIKIIGGEPLLAKEHDQFIQKLLETHNSLDQLEITYHTNGTILPSKKILEFWKKIKQVKLTVSVDGFGELNNYLRPGQSKWDTIDRNVRQFVSWALEENSNIVVSTHSVVSRINVMHLKELNDWIVDCGFTQLSEKEHTIDVLAYPLHMSLNWAPEDSKKLILTLIKNLLSENPDLVFSKSGMDWLQGVLSNPTPEDKLITVEQLEQEMKLLDNHFGANFSDLKGVL